jgi:hypothetical protein
MIGKWMAKKIIKKLLISDNGVAIILDESKSTMHH